MPQFNNIYTYENIQKRKMSVVPQDLDKREGSVVWTTVAANSIEMALAYIQMAINQDNSFPDTASRDYLIRHCALRGITPYPATYARIQGVFYSNVTDGTLFNPEVGSRFTVENTKITYRVTKQISDGNWELICETAGSTGNIREGVLVPVDEIQSLGSASIVGVLKDGDDEEETEALRKRYMDSLTAQSFAGNKAAYQDMVKRIDGVGACKVYRAFNGQETEAGHVGLCILNEDLEVPKQDDTLVADVQQIIDPKQDGEGVGMIPLDHIAHVFPAVETTIDVSVNVTPLYSGTKWDDILQTVTEGIQEYFYNLRKTWDSVDTLVVRPSQIIAKLLDIDVLLDVSECKVNGGTANIQLDSKSIPKVGVVSGEIV